MTQKSDLAAAAVNVVLAWERLGKCEDEFEDYGLGCEACGEYAERLDTAIIALKETMEARSPTEEGN